MKIFAPSRNLGFALFLFLIPLPSWGIGIQFGTGFSSFNSGRTVPALSAGMTFEDLGLFAATTGSRSELFYSSHTSLSFQWLWAPGTFLNSSVRAGVGLGGYTSERGYRDTTTADIHKTQDASFGFAFSVQWNAWEWFYLRGESILGVGSLTRALVLSFQDATLVSLGVEF